MALAKQDATTPRELRHLDQLKSQTLALDTLNYTTPQTPKFTPANSAVNVVVDTFIGNEEFAKNVGDILAKTFFRNTLAKA